MVTLSLALLHFLKNSSISSMAFFFFFLYTISNPSKVGIHVIKANNANTCTTPLVLKPIFNSEARAVAQRSRLVLHPVLLSRGLLDSGCFRVVLSVQTFASDLQLQGQDKYLHMLKLWSESTYLNI